MADSLDVLSLKTGQMMSILDQYRMNLFNQDLRINLLVKMLEEKGIFAKDEFTKRWPLYLKNDVGVLGSDNVMQGSLRVSFYGEESAT